MNGRRGYNARVRETDVLNPCTLQLFEDIALPQICGPGRRSLTIVQTRLEDVDGGVRTSFDLRIACGDHQYEVHFATSPLRDGMSVAVRIDGPVFSPVFSLSRYVSRADV
jgi:hypothetical protein